MVAAMILAARLMPARGDRIGRSRARAMRAIGFLRLDTV